LIKKVVSEDIIKFIDKLYNGNDEAFKRNNKPIKKHHIKYINDKYAPAWKTLEFFTFGQINKLFKALKDDDLKSQIAGSYGYADLAAFQNHITAIVNIRNICSHNGILFDHNQPIGVRKIPNKQYRIKSRNQTNLNASICVIFSILSIISKNRANDLKAQLDKLIAENMAIPELKQIIETKVGYEIN
jgi:abortive infection bacteriophage resistance protein